MVELSAAGGAEAERAELEWVGNGGEREEEIIGGERGNARVE